MQISRYLKALDIYSEAKYVNSVDVRADLAKHLAGLLIAKGAEVLPRLHMLPSDTGIRMARILGMGQTLVAQSEHFAVLPADPGNKEYMGIFNKNLVAHRKLIIKWVADIEINAKNLWNKALLAGSANSMEEGVHAEPDGAQ